VQEYLGGEHGLQGVPAQALARLAGGAVERAARLAEDARGAGLRQQYLLHGAHAVALQRGGDDPDPPAAFIGVLEREAKKIDERTQEQLSATLSMLELQFSDKRDLKWHRDRAEARAKREATRLRRVAAQDAVDLLSAWVRDLWVVACGASDVLWNCDRTDELVAAAVAAPEHYARLLAVIARTRKDLYLNIDQKLALQAMFARFEEVAASA
jgi:hypothetical protein